MAFVVLRPCECVHRLLTVLYSPCRLSLRNRVELSVTALIVSGHFGLPLKYSLCYFSAITCMSYSNKASKPFLFCYSFLFLSHRYGMTKSPQESSFSGHQSSAGLDTLLFWYSPPYGVSTHFRNFSSHFHSLRFSVLPQSESTLSIPLCSGLFNTAVGVLHKRWKPRGGRVALTSNSACGEMDFPFEHSREGDGYQRSLPDKLSGVRRWSTGRAIVVADLLCLSEYSAHFYFVANCTYESKELHFGVCVCAIGKRCSPVGRRFGC